MIYRHFRDVWLTTTPRGVVYGAFRRPRGASKATFRDPLFILWFINRHFIFGATLSLTWPRATLAAPPGRLRETPM